MLRFYMLQSFCFAFFSCCTLHNLILFSCYILFMLHYFQRCSQELTKPINSVAKLSILVVRGVLATHLLLPCCTFSMLHFFMLHSFHVALFSCCTILILKNIKNDQKIENKTKKRHNTQHHELVSLLF